MACHQQSRWCHCGDGTLLLSWEMMGYQNLQLSRLLKWNIDTICHHVFSSRYLDLWFLWTYNAPLLEIVPLDWVWPSESDMRAEIMPPRMISSETIMPPRMISSETAAIFFLSFSGFTSDGWTLLPSILPKGGDCKKKHQKQKLPFCNIATMDALYLCSY